MADLSAASQQDVVDFFKQWYAPANASLVIAGDVDAREVRAAVEKWFADVPKGEPVDPIARRARSCYARRSGSWWRTRSSCRASTSRG